MNFSLCTQRSIYKGKRNFHSVQLNVHHPVNEYVISNYILPKQIGIFINFHYSRKLKTVGWEPYKCLEVRSQSLWLTYLIMCKPVIRLATTFLQLYWSLKRDIKFILLWNNQSVKVSSFGNFVRWMQSWWKTETLKSGSRKCCTIGFSSRNWKSFIWGNGILSQCHRV